MNYHVLTLFPEMILAGMNTSIIGRAIEKGLISLEAVNIRDYAEEKRKGRVDDYPYGGGAGMVMQAEPVYAAYAALEKKIGKKPRVIYLNPQGQVFRQPLAEELAQEEDLVFLCGHYEGIDERVLEEIVTDHVSVGDYVLTGGDQDNLLEYPQYSRPEEWRGKKVPAVLLSGHHGNVEQWRREQSLRRTFERRPDLLERANLSVKDRKYLENLLAFEIET